MSTLRADLPPVMEVLLQVEFGKVRTAAGLRRKLTGLTRTLRRDAEWTEKNYLYQTGVPPSAGALAIPGPAMDPFSGAGKCCHVECRAQVAVEFAQTAALFVDRVVLPDPVTASMAGDLSTIDTDSLLIDLVCLRILRPLIDAGVVRFSQPLRPLCPACFQKSEKALARSLDAAIGRLATALPFQRCGHEYGIHLDELYDKPLVWAHPLSALELEQLESGVVSPDVIANAAAREKLFSESTLLAQYAGYARRLKAVLLTDAPVEAHVLAGLSAARRLRTQRREWELKRSVTLPWVSGLTTPDLVRLRDEAAMALPRLREVLAGIALEQSPRRADAALDGIVEQLRTEAIRAEVELRRILRRRVTRGALGIAGMTLFSTALATAAAQAPTALALAGLLVHLHSADEHDRSKAEEIRSSPAFVLVKAREIARRQ